jgi:GxxExxY protein
MGMSGDRGDEICAERGALTHRIIEAIIKVHGVLGPGFVESVYRRALLIELRKRNLAVSTEVEVEIAYDGQVVGRHRLDLIVDNTFIVELKTVDGLAKAHYSQVRSYLRATGLPLALLVNFAK